MLMLGTSEKKAINGIISILSRRDQVALIWNKGARSLPLWFVKGGNLWRQVQDERSKGITKHDITL